MKISESWLREWVNPTLTTSELVEQITMAGLEVDAVEPVAGDFSGVVVGEIMAIEQHPDADKLRVCQVAGNGAETTQVVCGAPNARVGIKIPFATVGAVLPENFKIKKAKLRGVESLGMLCAQTELQLGDDDDGLWELASDAPVGQDIRDYLSLNDNCIDIDLTPNRSDCFSIKGVARDIGVLNRLDINTPDIVDPKSSLDETLEVTLQAGDMCPRYVGRIIRNIDITQPTPLWMQERLRRSGIGSKDIIVDTTNYVLLELGQPLHAFDLEKISGSITVRKAKVKESIELLNGQTVELDEDTLVIADQIAALAIAGVMGGSASAVNASTKHIFLESAFFTPVAIAGKARRYGLHTDSSLRFERGVDYQLQEQAMARATQLITAIAGGDVAPLALTKQAHELLQARTVTLRRARIESGLGFAMADDEVLEILERLGLKKQSADNDSWTFTVPSYRFDINIEADLLEELARVYGYNRLPTTRLQMEVELPEKTETVLGVSAMRHHLAARDYQEVITYSFVEPQQQQLFQPEIAPANLQNPISADMAVMRTSLWPGLVQALQHNINRQQPRVRLFETGLRFLPNTDNTAASSADNVAGLLQQPMLAGLIYGPKDDESWLSGTDKSSNKVDFYDLKGDIESLLSMTGQAGSFSFAKSTCAALHPGQSADVIYDGQIVGTVGALHPQIQQKLGLSQPVYLFELQQAPIKAAALPRLSPLSRFPEVRRDLAVVVDQDIATAALEKRIYEAAGDNLTKLKVFDVYIGKGIDSHRKSVALGLTFQHLSRTLTDEEISLAVDNTVDSLKQVFNAELR